MTPSKRYKQLTHDYGLPISRTLTCGLHVHFKFRGTVDLANALTNLRPYLPIISAASTSSPFWCGYDTRLQSYRRAVYDALPRSGIPPVFANTDEYNSYFVSITNDECLTDSTTTWWDARLNNKHGTLEVRVSDSLPDLDQTHAVILLTAACVQLAACGILPDISDPLIFENRWRAMKCGRHAKLFFFGESQGTQLGDVLNSIFDAKEIENLMSKIPCKTQKIMDILVADSVAKYTRYANDMSEQEKANHYLIQALLRTQACTLRDCNEILH